MKNYPLTLLRWRGRSGSMMTSLSESQQIGIASQGFDRGRFATSEDGTHAFDGRIARFYLEHIDV